MSRHNHVRLGLGTIATVLIILVVVGIIGTYAVKYYKSNFRFFKENVATSYASITNNAKESLNIENVAYYNSTQSFNLTLTNTGQVGLSILNVTLTDTNGNIIESNTTVATGGIQIDNHGVSNSTNANHNTYRLTLNQFTVADHKNRILVVTAGAESDPGGVARNTCSIVSVTYGLQSLTNATGRNLDDSGADQCDGIWYLINPPVGTAKVVITYANTGGSSMVDMSGGAISIYDAAQQGPESTATNALTSSPGFIGTNIVTLSDTDLLVDGVGSGNPLSGSCNGNTGGPFTPGSGQTQAYQVGASSSSISASTKLAPSASSSNFMSESECALRLVHVLAAFKPITSLPPSPVTSTVPGTICAILPTRSCTASITYHGFTNPVIFSITTSSGHVYTTTVTPVVSWYDNNWQFRKAITINSTKVVGTLSGFPVLINTTDTDLKNNAQSDGSDILFTTYDGKTPLNYEIENYTSSTGSLTAWVKLPGLYNVPNNVIYMYYGNSGGCGIQNPAGTWDSNYEAVYHLGENPITGSGPIILNNVKSVSTTSDGSGNSQLQNFDINFGTNRILIVGVIGDRANATNVTYGSQSLTKVTSTYMSNNVTGSIWYLVNPLCNTATITAQTNGISKDVVIGAYSLYGVDQSNPIPTVAAPTSGTCASNPCTSISITNADANSWVLDLAGVASKNGVNTPTQTQEWSVPGLSKITSASSKAGPLSNGTPKTFQWNAVTLNSKWIEMAIEVQAAGQPNTILLDATTNKAIGTVSSFSFTHNVGSSISNSLLVVGVSIAKTPHVIVSGITDNGVSLPAPAVVKTGGSDIRTEIWYYKNPPPGANTIAITFNATVGSDGATVGAISLQGVDQTNPIGATSSAGTTSGNPSVSITTNNDNSWLVDTVAWDANLNGSATAPQTPQWRKLASAMAGFGSTLVTTTHGSYSMGWTIGSDNWSETVVEIKPSPSGSSAALVPPIHDSTSNHNDLTPNSLVITDQIHCQFGRCLNFDGSTKYLSRIGSLNSIPANNAAQTGSFWFWVSANPATQDIYSIENSGSSSYLQTGFSGSNNAAWKGSGAGTSLVSTAPLAANKWHYFVYTYDGATNTLYIDGVQKTTSATAPNAANPSSLYIGKYSGGQFFSGKIDELRISSINRPANWITTEYHNQASPSSFYTVMPQENVYDMRIGR